MLLAEYALVKDLAVDILEGGPGSGHWGHKGRPGRLGGSLPGGIAAHAMTPGGVHRRYSSNFMAKYILKKIEKNGPRYGQWDAALAKLKGKFPGQPEARYERALVKAGFVLGGEHKPGMVRVKAAQKRAAGVVAGDREVGGVLKNILKSGSAESIERLGGGCNGSYVIRIKDDGKAVLKPKSEERGGLRRFIPGGGYYKREAAVYAVASVTGMADLVPETYVRVDPGKGKSSVQAFVEDGKIAMRATTMYGGSTKDLKRAALLDYVTGNQDRHDANWLVAGAGKKLRLIDNGLSFPNAGGYLRSYLFNKAVREGMAIPGDIANQFTDNRKTVLETVETMVGHAAAKHTEQRLNVLEDVMKIGPEPEFSKLRDLHKARLGDRG